MQMRSVETSPNRSDCSYVYIVELILYILLYIIA